MLKKIKRIFKIGELWSRVELLEADNDLLKQQNNDLDSRIKKLEYRTISERTLEQDTVSPSRVLDEWLNGEDGADE